VVLFKPLAMFGLNDASGVVPIDAVSTGGFTGQLALAHPNACLTMIGFGQSAQAINGALLLAEV
jgi:hypothetical protein